MDQLNQMPYEISILSLFLSFEDHRGSMLKFLNEAHVPQDIKVYQFKKVMANITTSCCLGFSNEELLSEGWPITRPYVYQLNAKIASSQDC